MEGVLGPSEESLIEMEKQAEIEKMKKKKILVKTPSYLENKHTLGELEKKICLSEKEIAERKGAAGVAAADTALEAEQIQDQMFQVA